MSYSGYPCLAAWAPTYIPTRMLGTHTRVRMLALALGTAGNPFGELCS
jgi:hypothetical protein